MIGALGVMSVMGALGMMVVMGDVFVGCWMLGVGC